MDILGGNHRQRFEAHQYQTTLEDEDDGTNDPSLDRYESTSVAPTWQGWELNPETAITLGPISTEAFQGCQNRPAALVSVMHFLVLCQAGTCTELLYCMAIRYWPEPGQWPVGDDGAPKAASVSRHG